MTKITLNDLSTISGNEQSAINLINANNALIETASDNTLSRDGTSPNQMLSSLDMNSFRILNLPSPVLSSDPVRLQDMITFAGGGTIASFPTTSAQLAALITDETGAGSLVFGTSPTFTTGITVNGTATFTPTTGGAALTRGFQTAQSLAGTAVADFVANSISISTDNSDVGTNALYGLAIGHTFGGSSTKGNRSAILGFLNLGTTTSASNTQRNYVAGDFIAQTSAGDGGTGVTSATGKGAIFGVGGSANITAGTNFLNITGAEFGVIMAAGTSVWYKSLIQAVGGLGDAVKGSGIDAMVVLSNQSNTVLWDDGILIAAPNGFWPIKSTGTLFRTADSGTATNGIDFSNTTFSGSAFKSTGFSVDGSGNMQILSGTAVPAGGTAGAGYKLSSIANLGLFFGSGAPTLSAAQGSIYLRTDGGANTRIYSNNNGTTGWSPMTG